MSERVEEIRRRHGGPHESPSWMACDVCDLLTALAQAERVRDEITQKFQEQRKLLNRYEMATGFDERVEARAAAYHNEDCLFKTERDAARAEVERLKDENLGLTGAYVQLTGAYVQCTHANGALRADLARVRAAHENMENALARDHVDSVDIAVTGLIGHIFNCYRQRVRAALEGRGS